MQLTFRQKSVYDVIRYYYRWYGYSPTVREICQRLGLAGPAGVHRILKILEERGYIRSAPGKKRSWVPADSGEEGQGMPVAGRIAAGKPLDVWDCPDERIPVDPMFYGNGGCFALRVSGDSMIGENIRNNDLAVIRPQDDAENGEIAAVMVEGILTEATLKKVSKRQSALELHSANPAYPVIRISVRDQMKVRIIGKYVGLIRKEDL